MAKHLVPDLPFSKDALEPFMSEETLEYHHDKHHKGYVDKLNELIVGTPFENKSLEHIVRNSEGAIFNNGAQAWNHAFFWKCLTPGQPKISPMLLALIEKDFGSFHNFQASFVQKGIEVFGSGWLWLIQEDDKLKLEAKHDADNPLTQGRQPLLACDLWEHSYYIDYRNDRKNYLKAFVKVIHWDFVAGNLKKTVDYAA